jgi:methyltransferase (TIGR00027 family)
VARTCVFDQTIQRAVADGADAVLNLAAGLDTRPYRLELPASLRWIEVDLEEILAYKQGQLASAQPRCNLTRIAQDLNDREESIALFERIAREHRRVLVVSEGLLGYLAPARVEALTLDLARQRTFELWLLDFHSPSSLKEMNRLWGSALAAGGTKVSFAPPGGPEFFERFGWKIRGLWWTYDEAVRIGRFPAWTLRIRSLVWLAGKKKLERLKRERLPGFVLLERVKDPRT